MAKKKDETIDTERSASLMVDRTLFLASLKILKIYYDRLLDGYEHAYEEFPDEPEIVEELREQLDLVGSMVHGFDCSVANNADVKKSKFILN